MFPYFFLTLFSEKAPLCCACRVLRYEKGELKEGENNQGRNGDGDEEKKDRGKYRG
jgi:hypothetical protein